MEIIIDVVTELEYKTGPALRFNVMFKVEDTYISIPGFRWMDGCLHPPAVRIKSGWYPTAFIGTKAATGLYEALKAELKDMGIASKYPMMSIDVAIEKVVDKSAMCRYFPRSIGK